MDKRHIPLVDISLYTDGDSTQKNRFVEQLGDAFRSVGFVGVINHGVPAELIEAFYREAKAFFALPEEVKTTYEIPGISGQRGYTAFGKEHARQSTTGDLKEFFQIGQEYPDDPAFEAFPKNMDVRERPDFLRIGIRLYKQFEHAGGILLRAIATHLDLPEAYFEQHIEYGSSILRAIHYPPIVNEPETAIRAEQHEDINLITLLVGASAGGLELLNMKGEWVPVVPGKDEIVVNVGDMLQRLTNNDLKSTTHRVVNPPRERWHIPRLSIPFFLHPKPSMDLACLPACVTEENPLAYQPVTAGEYLSERLREIGLKT